MVHIVQIASWFDYLTENTTLIRILWSNDRSQHLGAEGYNFLRAEEVESTFRSYKPLFFAILDNPICPGFRYSKTQLP